MKALATLENPSRMNVGKSSLFGYLLFIPARYERTLVDTGTRQTPDNDLKSGRV